MHAEPRVAAAGTPRHVFPIEAERAAAQRAGVALHVAGPVMALSILSAAMALRSLRARIDDIIDTIDRTPAGQPVRFDAGQFGLDSTWFLLAQIGGIAATIAGILFVVWLHRASTTARALGLPQRYGPAWAWLGFVVPIAHLFVPYGVAGDALPSGHPDRALVARWWVAYLCASMGAFPLLGAAIVDSTLALLVVAVVFGGLWIAAAVLGRRVIVAVLDAHEVAARR